MIFDRRETGIPADRINQVPLPAYAAMLISRLPFPASQTWSYYIGDSWFDRAASHYAAEADIYHVFNHHGLHGIRAAKRAGAITIVEWSSAQPYVQHALLRDEYARFGLRYPASNRPIIAKHVQEYAEADWIMVASEFVHRTMIAEGVPAAKLRKVHLGFAPELFRPGKKTDDSENVGAAVRNGEDGFIVPIRSAEAVAAKLAYLYTHETERTRMGRSAREYVSRFIWDRYQGELIDHYREIWGAR